MQWRPGDPVPGDRRWAAEAAMDRRFCNENRASDLVEQIKRQRAALAMLAPLKKKKRLEADDF